jgi:hypothetical protein
MPSPRFVHPKLVEQAGSGGMILPSIISVHPTSPDARLVVWMKTIMDRHSSLRKVLVMVPHRHWLMGRDGGHEGSHAEVGGVIASVVSVGLSVGLSSDSIAVGILVAISVLVVSASS